MARKINKLDKRLIMKTAKRLEKKGYSKKRALKEAWAAHKEVIRVKR